ncbi:MAG: flagellar biosynthetic protein FliO [Methylobacteriaceae bacterium]|nr:flagellar biosynthetic protein FliO [Methylobacteriaceae bacterium]
MSFFGENRTLAFVLAAVCLLIGVALVFVLFRIVFGRGIKLPGGRSRQQRLGIVDAFEIDRQRQLVIVRRDNVEHLLMIGGPNDVVVESSIIRAEAREGRPARDREQPAIGGLSWPAGPGATEGPAEPGAEAARAAVPEPPPPPISVVPPPRSQPAAPPPPEPALEPGATESSAPAPPPSPRPMRPPPPPLRPIGAGERPALTPRPPLTPLRREPRPLPPFLSTRAKPAEPPPPTPAEPATTEAVAAASEQPAPAAPEASPPPAEEAAPPPPATDEQPSTAPKIELDPLESLEEEMAKLLGRSPGEGR